MKIEFFRHSIEESDIKRVGKVLNSIFLTTGDEVKDFEKKFADYLCIKEVVGLTSCTAALHLSLIIQGIGHKDEVITAPMSFCATSNAIIQAGAIPVFADVEENTGNVNVDLIEDKITKRTKAILPVHLYGQMCDMRKIRKLADKYGLAVIEDAAHCIEGRRDGVRVGELGDAACFSFYATKNLTSGEGGAIAINDYQKSELLRMLRLHGIDKSAVDRYTKKYRHWDMPVLGWKYNMDNIHAALLIGQLGRIERLWKRRDYLWRKYESAFKGVKGIKFMQTLTGTKHGRHLFTIQVNPERRDLLLYRLQEKGIGVAVNYRAIHLLKYYRDRFNFKEGDFPVAEDIGARTISLPLYPALKDRQINYVIKTVLEEIRH